MCFESELVIGLRYLLVVAAIAAVEQLRRMVGWVVVQAEQFDGLLEVICCVAGKEVCLLLTLRISLFGLLPLSLHYYKL